MNRAPKPGVSPSNHTASTAAGGAALDARALTGRDWARQAIGRPALIARPLAGDASFRRYFRLEDGGEEWVLMDAPTDREDTSPFIEVTQRLRAAGLRAPALVATEPDQGFLLLEDLGDDLLRDALTPDSAATWFPRLLGLLADLAHNVSARGLPPYDRPRLQEELELFPEWYLWRHKGIRLDCAQLDLWEDLATRLLVSAEAQPQVFVHRDFHSCNLLVLPDESLGIIDHQDAVEGPLSYDFASLVWDRYISWPRAQIEAWSEDFRQRVAPRHDPEDWQRTVDWMGLQRNLKIVGIFARLYYRDGKTGYLEMIPQFWGYVRDTLRRYPEFSDFDALLEQLSCAP